MPARECGWPTVTIHTRCQVQDNNPTLAPSIETGHKWSIDFCLTDGIAIGVLDSEIRKAGDTWGFKQKCVGKFVLVPHSRRSAGHLGSHNAMQAWDFHALTEDLMEASTCVWDLWKLICHLMPIMGWHKTFSWDPTCSWRSPTTRS